MVISNQNLCQHSARVLSGIPTHFSLVPDFDIGEIVKRIVVSLLLKCFYLPAVTHYRLNITIEQLPQFVTHVMPGS